MDEITARLEKHYSRRFAEHGATPRGVDWSREEDVNLRYEKMLAVVEPSALNGPGRAEPASLLDVGCGYGGLYVYAKAKQVELKYTGVDVVKSMVEYASAELPEATFRHQDVFDLSSVERYDYVVSSGILTQKLTASIREMDDYARRLIKKMFELCRRGIAFNVMTTKVNFMVENLYYRNPVELFAYCFTEISEVIKIDHAYPLYEYTIYLYRS